MLRVGTPSSNKRNTTPRGRSPRSRRLAGWLSNDRLGICLLFIFALFIFTRLYMNVLDYSEFLEKELAYTRVQLHNCCANCILNNTGDSYETVHYRASDFPLGARR